MNTTWTIYFDGACEPKNPGGYACYGWCLFSPDNCLIASGSGCDGHGEGQTNNTAEYAALENALLYIKEQNLTIPLLCKGDSMLVVNQVSLKWNCKKKHLEIRRDRIRNLLEIVGRPWKMQWIPREENEEADMLSKIHLQQLYQQ